MRQHNIWCVYVCPIWRGMLDCSPAHLSKQNTRTHTTCYAAASPHQLFTFLTNFKIIDFNKKYMSSLKMIWMRSEHVVAFLGVLTIWRLTATIWVVPHSWHPDATFYIFIQQIYVLNILNMLHNLRFFPLQNAVYFIMLPFLVPVLFTF